MKRDYVGYDYYNNKSQSFILIIPEFSFFKTPLSNKKRFISIVLMPHDSKLTVVAVEDIKCGDEIVVSYIDEEQPTRKRQDELLEKYGFVCLCPKCKAKK